MVEGKDEASLAPVAPRPSSVPLWLIPPALALLILWGDPLTAIVVGAAKVPESSAYSTNTKNFS